MNSVDPAYIDAAAWVLLLAPLLPLSVAVLFLPDAISNHMPTRERAGIAFRDFLLAAWVGFLAASYLFGWQWAPELGFGLTVLAYLSISVPSAIWLWLYLTNRFA